MADKLLLSVILAVLIFAGVASIYLSYKSFDFTFYKSELSINERAVNETLYFSPDKPLHTLFRNFDSNIQPKQYTAQESITVKYVQCSSGTPYVRALGVCLNFMHNNSITDCMAYTENNEYGCSFGPTQGFAKGMSYSVNGIYSIEPPMLFRYQGKTYIKFIAYDAWAHPYLEMNKNFFVENALASEKYFPAEDVVIYIPYPDNSGIYPTMNVKSLNFGTSSLRRNLFMAEAFLPAVLVLIVWFLFCRKPDESIPKELSDIPTKIKPWQASVTANYSQMAVPATLLEFYKKKIIDIKTMEKAGFFGKSLETYIKIIKSPESLDDIEKQVYNLLKIAEKNSQRDKEGYFILEKAYSNELRKSGTVFTQSLKSEQKKLFNAYPFAFIFIFGILFTFLVFSLKSFWLAVPAITHLVIAGILAFSGNSLFYSFKDNKSYKDYLMWNSFRRFLKNSYSMRASDVKGIILWNEYLIYATALGVSEKILKRLRKDNLISEENYRNYQTMNYSLIIFATNSGSGGASGGGHAGGGGVGGGGGGGR